jgi:hypothetical protein
MGKISSYAVDGNPQFGDKLIGTEVNTNNETKNYTLSSIFALFGSQTGSNGFVPYTGAIGNVNLGSNTLTANSIIKTGGLPTQFLKADGSVDSNTYLSSATASSTYVPYTGATTNVNLGSNSLTSTDITITGKLSANGSFGTSGQVLVSQGGSLPAQWQTAPGGGGATATLVANRPSTSTQNTTAFDTPIVVTFGGFFSNAQVTITPSGLITFNQAGAYAINVFINAVSLGPLSSVSPYLLFRGLINGSQVFRSRPIFVSGNPNISSGYEYGIMYQASASDTIGFELMTVATGAALGGLAPFSATSGWLNVPSAEIAIWKIG